MSWLDSMFSPKEQKPETRRQDGRIVISDADKARLLRLKPKPVRKSVHNIHLKSPSHSPRIERTDVVLMQTGEVSEEMTERPVITGVIPVNQAEHQLASQTPAVESSVTVYADEPQAASDEPVTYINTPLDNRMQEECCCATLDILFDGMEHGDKASKEAAKHLLTFMESRVGDSISLLVFNSYVRQYNAIRERCYASAMSNLKSKTVRIRDELLDNIAQMTRTVNVEVLSGIGTHHHAK